MAARWPLVLALLVVLGVGAVLARPALTDEPCDVVGGTGTPHETVGELLTAMNPGETGCLHGYPAGGQPSSAGFYEEQVTIGKSGVTLRSHPGEVAQIKGRLSIVQPNVTVSHLVLDGRNASDQMGPRISQLGDGARLVDNVITTRSTISCVWLDGTPTDILENVVIEHNRIHDCNVGVTVEYADYSTISHNLIYDNRGTGVLLTPDADVTGVSWNVIDRSAHSVKIGTNSDANAVGMNILANPKTWNLGFAPQPGSYNAFSSNCVWKDGGDGIDSTHTTTGWDDFYKVVLTGNVTANPDYMGAASEGAPPDPSYTIPDHHDCFPQTGSMSSAVTDGERPARAQAVNLRPNVLFIVTDDQRADTMDMGVMPNTLKWFKEGTPTNGSYGAIRGGTRYDQAFATTPLCCPSRASIFSGRFAHNNDPNSDGLWLNQNGNKLPSKTILPAYLKGSGLDYYNAMYGKYLNGWSGCTSEGEDVGGKRHDDDVADGPPTAPAGTPPNFDDYSVYETNYLDFPARENGTCTRKPADHTTSYTFSKAESFLTERESNDDEQPWFLYLAPSAPHHDGQKYGVDAWREMTEAPSYDGIDVPTYQPPLETDRLDKPDRLSADNQVVVEQPPYRGLQKQQLRTLKFLDDKVEPFMAKLESTYEADDTLAFFISDNGYLWREHGAQAGDCINPAGPPEPPAPQPNPDCGMTGKQRPYLESIKIPFFVRWPDNPAVGANHVEPTIPVATVDLATTAMDAVDVTPAPEDPLDGRSVLGSISRPWMLIEYSDGIDHWRSLVNAEKQFIEHYRIDDIVKSRLELYDLREDAIEHENLYGSGAQPGEGEPDPLEFRTPLAQYQNCKGSACP
jgi:arylsulfatase A-like enzyme